MSDRSLLLELADRSIQIIVTDLGIEKSHDIILDENVCRRVIEKVKDELVS